MRRIKHGHLSATRQAPLQSAGRTRLGTAPVRACVVRWHATNAAAGRTRADHVAVGHLHSHDLLRDLWQLITVLGRSRSRSGWEFTVADRHERRRSGRQRLRGREAGRAPRPRPSPTPTGFQLGDPRFSGSADPHTRHSRRLKSRAGEGRHSSPPSSSCRRRRRLRRRRQSPPGAPAPASGAAGGRVCSQMGYEMAPTVQCLMVTVFRRCRGPGTEKHRRRRRWLATQPLDALPPSARGLDLALSPLRPLAARQGSAG